MKGNSVRSLQQWLKEGEKPSKFCITLRMGIKLKKKRNNQNVQLNDGFMVTDQKEVLHHVRKCYKKAM